MGSGRKERKMQRSALCALACLGLAAAAPLSGARADACADAGDQATMTECAESANRASDAELNEPYKKIRSRLQDDAEAAGLLGSAKRAGIDRKSGEWGTSVAGRVEPGCRRRLKKK